ncbi:hypothetical protein KIPB_013185, partial [Kipferlia bialata]
VPQTIGRVRQDFVSLSFASSGDYIVAGTPSGLCVIVSTVHDQTASMIPIPCKTTIDTVTPLPGLNPRFAAASHDTARAEPGDGRRRPIRRTYATYDPEAQREGLLLGTERGTIARLC